MGSPPLPDAGRSASLDPHVSVTRVNPSYTLLRPDILKLALDEDCTSVLDVGCAEGALGAEIKRRRPRARVVGIEIDEAMAQVARERLDSVLVGDAGGILAALAAGGDRFSLVICADILEHLVDPWRTLRTVAELSPSAVVVGLPNVAHVSTLVNLLFRHRWPYRDRGIHDRTHLRFFGRANLPELFDAAGLVEVRRITRRRLLESPSPVNRLAEPLLAVLPAVRSLTEYQYISLLRPAANKAQ